MPMWVLPADAVVGMVFRRGEIIRKVPEDQILDELNVGRSKSIERQTTANE